MPAQSSSGHAAADFDPTSERAQLHALSDALSAARDATAVWRAVFAFAGSVTPADSILISLYEPIRQERVCVYVADEDGEQEVSALPPMPLGDSPQSLAIRSAAPVLTDDLNEALSRVPSVDVGLDAPADTQSSLAVPMRARDEILGVVELQSYQPAAFRPEHADLLSIAAGMAATASDNLRVPSSTRNRVAARAARRLIAAIIAEQAFAPVYQPIVDLAANETVGYEALTRFADGTAPDQQFAKAEGCGLGLELEAATLAAALSAAQSLPRDAWLALNVSPRMVLGRQPLRDLIAWKRRRIVLEVTEHAAIGDYRSFRHALRRLPPRNALAIDDAGAGYASFRHIFELRPQFVKLSNQFVRGIDRDPARQALVRGLASFADASGSTLVAEGLETRAELASVRSIGVPLGQGYLLGRPARVDHWPTAMKQAAPFGGGRLSG